jgi:two-component system sensor histidine kinase and response regulator WspE
VRIEDITLPLDDFAQLMGISTTSAKQEDMFLIIMGTGNQRRALLVDGVQGEQDIVIRALDSRMVKLFNIQGSAMLRDGGIALVVDTSDLIQSMKDSADSSYSSYDEQGSLISEQDEGRASAHILVVEDSATVREVERHMLEQAGYRVTTAVNGVDGFNKLRNDLFDVIVSDIDMPRMNGIEMITKIRGLEKYLKIPIIVVSYKDREQDRMQAFEAGANHYVTKSAFDLGEMMQQIKAFIGANWTAT